MLSWDAAGAQVPHTAPQPNTAREHLLLFVWAEHLAPLCKQGSDTSVHWTRSLSLPECTPVRNPSSEKPGPAGLGIQKFAKSGSAWKREAHA